jgi:hypothetical protein
MNGRWRVLLVPLAALLTTLLIPATTWAASAAPAASAPTAVGQKDVRTVAIPISRPEAHTMGVDCIGDGASCVGYLNGTQGEVDVTNNTNPHDYWRFKLTCLWGGDQYSGDNPPSAASVKSYLGCNLGSPAEYWNVLVDYIP